MARFVLVHGAFAGAWIWGPLIDRLKATGHSVEVFDLPASGDDHTPALPASARYWPPARNRPSWPATVWVALLQLRERHAVPAVSGRSSM
jgi:alpha-beta hydrolase superfamily lysophospholipase